MTRPNINNAAYIYASNAQVSLGSTAATQIISNPADTGAVMLIDSVIVANTDPNATVSVTVTRYNSATNTGTPYHLAHQVPVAGGQSLVVIEKGFGVSLAENQSIYVSASAASKLTVDANWKEIL